MQLSIPTWRPKHWAAIIVAFCAVTALALSTSTAHRLAAQSPDERVVSVYDGESEQTFVTKAATVREALEKAQTKLGPNDAVEPALNTQLVASNYNINVYRARPVVVVDGERRETILSPNKSAKQIAEKQVSACTART